ncbi:MAG: rhodanese-like domain-containing protein [Anaerolineae bacterium]|nr:rhodanese-like domain-containing protein [Anaerolineae bacterium]
MSDLQHNNSQGGETALAEQTLKHSRAASNATIVTMKLISREELKEKLDKKEAIKLVFALGDWHYRIRYIPGSLHFQDFEEALKVLDQDDEIVVYCSNEACAASRIAYHFLVNHGYKNVRRYAGGLMDWMDAGYPLEGEGLK